MNIKTAVSERLTGYAVIMVSNVLLFGKTAAIQTIRTPQTPRVVSIAGVREMPNPRRYPDITS